MSSLARAGLPPGIPAWAEIARRVVQNPNFRSYAARAGRYAAAGVASRVGNYLNTPRRPPVARRLFTPTGAPTPAGVVPSGTSTRRVSRPGRRFYGIPVGKYRGKKYGHRGRMKKRRFRRKGRGSRGKMLGKLWKMMHCPQEVKVTSADYKISDGYGVRTWKFLAVGTAIDLKNCSARRPNSLFYANSTTGSAATQTPYGEPRKLHLSLRKKFILQNRCNWMMHLKVYECLLRRDHNYSDTKSGSAFDAWMKDILDDSENTLYNRGPVQEALGGVNNNLVKDYHNPMFTPYNSSPFCSMFKILKCTSLQLSPNDYQTYYVSCRRKAFDQSRIDGYINANAKNQYLDGIGGWSKVLIFTWVGGPVDTGNLTQNQQSKAANALAYQIDTNLKFWYELDSQPLRTIVSSNAGNTEYGFTDNNTYKTLNNIVYGIPNTEVVEAISAPSAAILSDDAPALNPVG